MPQTTPVKPGMAEFYKTLVERARRDPGVPVPKPTTSAWQSVPHDLANHESPSLPSRVSIIVIGSGMTGISTAYHLLQDRPDLAVTVLEARSVISGATGRNGGHCKEVPYVDYTNLKAMHGKEGAQRIVRFRLGQLNAMFKTAAKLGPEVTDGNMLRRVEGIDLYFDRQVFNKMRLNLEAWLEDFPEERGRWAVWEGDGLGEQLARVHQRFGAIDAIGCMTGPAGALWPYKFVGGVLSALSNNHKYPNFTVEAHTPVESISISGIPEYPYEVRTPRGIIIARSVIHCTNAHAGHLLPGIRGKIFPIRGQMTLQSVPPSFPRVGDKKSWLLHYSPGLDYITQSPLPSGELYLGGGSLKALLSGNVQAADLDIGNVRDDQQSEEALKALESVMEKRFRNGKGAMIRKNWTGIMGYTIDNLPIVGRVPYSISGRNLGIERSNEWTAVGFCGHGMAYCWLTGKGVAEMVLTSDENIGDWFPWREFACSEERFERTNLERGVESFLGSVA